MSIRQLESWQSVAPRMPSPPPMHLHHGHRHIWQHEVARRRFLQAAAAGATGVVLGAGIGTSGRALAAPPGSAEPRPVGVGFSIPGIGDFHVFGPGPGMEPSTITDFNGFIGVAVIRGMGTETNPKTRATRRLPYEVDMRYMEGEYVGLDGRNHHGAFAFI